MTDNEDVVSGSLSVAPSSPRASPSDDSTPKRKLQYNIKSRDAVTHKVLKGLQNLYRNKLRPIEEQYQYSLFADEPIRDVELQAKAHVLVIGQYSTGKTTFIRHVLGQDFPNMHIGPEPTSDKFMVVMHGEEDQSMDGGTLASIPQLPYMGLADSFDGPALDKHLSAAVSTAKILENVTLVDTPGVLSGPRYKRTYDFPQVTKWFADRSDLVLLLFDAHKLDVSEELKAVMTGLMQHQEKVRIVLNKADQMDKENLLRVYGALLYNIGKILPRPEVVKVYVGSFWEEPYKFRDFEELFEKDQRALVAEIEELPRKAAPRKLNDITRRTRQVKAHACILSHVRQQMPSWWGGGQQRQQVLSNLKTIFEEAAAHYRLHETDLPDITHFRKVLSTLDFYSFPTLSGRQLRQLDEIISKDIPNIMKDAGGPEKVYKFTGAYVDGKLQADDSEPSRSSLLDRATQSMRFFNRGQSTGSIAGASLGGGEVNVDSDEDSSEDEASAKPAERKGSQGDVSPPDFSTGRRRRAPAKVKGGLAKLQAASRKVAQKAPGQLPWILVLVGVLVAVVLAYLVSGSAPPDSLHHLPTKLSEALQSVQTDKMWEKVQDIFETVLSLVGLGSSAQPPSGGRSRN